LARTRGPQPCAYGLYVIDDTKTAGFGWSLCARASVRGWGRGARVRSVLMSAAACAHPPSFAVQRSAEPYSAVEYSAAASRSRSSGGGGSGSGSSSNSKDKPKPMTPALSFPVMHHLLLLLLSKGHLHTLDSTNPGECDPLHMLRLDGVEFDNLGTPSGLAFCMYRYMPSRATHSVLQGCRYIRSNLLSGLNKGHFQIVFHLPPPKEK